MKKFLPVFVLLVGFVSCGLKDKNISLVSKEFQAYVQKSFDDPKTLKEIVEIAPSDTISLSSIKSMVIMSDSLIDITRKIYSIKDSLSTAKIKDQINVLKHSRGITYSDAYTAQLLAIEVMTTIQKIVNLRTKLDYQQESLNRLCDSLEYMPALYIYDIIYRKQYPEGLKLETVYAYVDSLSGFKSILTEKKDDEMMCPEYSAVFEKSKDCMITLNNIETLYQKKDEQAEELFKFILRVE